MVVVVVLVYIMVEEAAVKNRVLLATLLSIGNLGSQTMRTASSAAARRPISLRVAHKKKMSVPHKNNQGVRIPSLGG